METSLFDKFEDLLDKGVFLGTIREDQNDSEDDIQKDGKGGKKIVSLLKTPVLSLMKKYRGDSQNNGSLSIVQQASRDGPPETRKFYFRTKIMEAFDSSVILETVDSPTTPKEGKFILVEAPASRGANPAKVMRNLDDVYVVLNEKKELISVHKDGIKDAYLVCLVIFSSEKGRNPQNGDTAIYFPSIDGKYYYYLIPSDDSSETKCPIDVEQVCIERMTEDQKDQNIRDHLFFSQQYNNQSLFDGACGVGPSHHNCTQYSERNGFTLPTEVEKG